MLEIQIRQKVEYFQIAKCTMIAVNIELKELLYKYIILLSPFYVDTM